MAEALRGEGIDAWWDVWEIRPGDNFVSRISDGLEQCECGVVFLSNASLAGAWQQDEITILKTYAVDERRPLIPVLLDSDVKVPAILRPYSRLSAEQISDLADAIIHRTANKPALGAGRPAPSRVRFSIHLRELPNSAIGVSAQLDGKVLAGEQSVTAGAGFAFSYADFVRARPLGARQQPGEGIGASRERDLVRLGEAVGRVVFAGDVGRQLAECLTAGATGQFQEIELVFESASARLLSIPFEAARLADGRVPALMPGVFTWRSPARSNHPRTQAPSPGPLKILVAVGAPYEDKTDSAVLNIERELETILNAVEKAHVLGNAYVRVLEIGSPDQIGAALRELGYHVLHLSGHGNQAVLELEDEDGNPVPVKAGELAARIRDSGHPPPLIVLSSCHGGRDDHESGGFAQGLLDSGVPGVLAMQTAVSDYYATELAGRFYEELARAEQPLASRALALARRHLEQSRKAGSQSLPDAARIPEYATPSLFLRGEEQAVFNRAVEQVPVPEPPPTPASGAVPMLKIGDLIGRRREARQIIGVLTDDPKTLGSAGRKAGCQILGTGGVGKSSLAGRIMQRMADRGWPVATVGASWNISQISSEIAAALWGHPRKELAALARNLGNPEAPDQVRLSWLQTILGSHCLLLVLDNFEDVLTPAGTEFSNPVAAQLFAFFVQSAQRAKLLITSRYPVPICQERLHRVDLGPLSSAETRKLMLRHEGLKRQPSEKVRLIERAIGGHPRTLEYLDALLLSGTARLDAVQARLQQFAGKEGISLRAGVTLEEGIRDAIRLAAADAMVAELVRVVGQNATDLSLLWQACVFPFPVPVEALAFDPAFPRAEIDLVPLAPAVKRLAATSLLTPLTGNSIYVHRWTAESLQEFMPVDAYRASCRRAADYLKSRPASDLRQWVADLVESTRLYLACHAFDEAVSCAWQLISSLVPRGQTTLWTELAREVGNALPAGHDDKPRFLAQEADGLLALGFAGEALHCYRLGLQLNESKVAQEPGRADYLRDLSVSYSKMGDLQRALGEGEAARQFYEKALEIAERLVAQEPGRADYLRDLSVSYERMGDLQRALGEGEAARQFYEKALEIAERLVAQEPGRADYLRDLSVSYERMGDLQRALGEGEAARQFYEKALELLSSTLGS